MIFRKKTKKSMAFILLMVSMVVIIFNNVGQFFTLINLPFARNIQIWAGIIGAVIAFVWYSYLEGAIK